MNIRALVPLLFLACTLGPPTTHALAQESPVAATVPASQTPVEPSPAAASNAPVAKDAEPRAQIPGDQRLVTPASVSAPGFSGFMHDVGGDYQGFFSKGAGLTLGIGGAAAGVVHVWDADIRKNAAGVSSSVTNFLKGGEYYGGPLGQYGLAFGWWAAARLAGSGKSADAGRDLVRAQISATSWTYLSKFVTQRDRPNGDPRAFPSGHTSSTFATATVLQRYYGWKVGVPFYALGFYAGASRIVAEKHWTSDVVFGAAVGVASGYTATRRIHSHTVAMSPAVYPGGAGVSFSVEP
jgi:hypothetical protein